MMSLPVVAGRGRDKIAGEHHKKGVLKPGVLALAVFAPAPHFVPVRCAAAVFLRGQGPSEGIVHIAEAAANVSLVTHRLQCSLRHVNSQLTCA